MILLRMTQEIATPLAWHWTLLVCGIITGIAINALILVRNFMSTTPVTRAELDAALDSAVTVIQTAITDLEAKIANGTVNTTEDFSAEVAKLNAIANAAKTADPGAQPAPPAPPAATT